MYYIWLLLIVTSCTAAQRCAESSNKNTYGKKTYRVSDEAFHSLFTDAVVTTSRIHCLTLCTRNHTNAYYVSSTRRCRCHELCVSYSPISTGANYIEKFNALDKSLCMTLHSNMSSLCSF